MTPPRTSAAQLEAVGRLQATFDHEGLDHWVFGGWAVDLHLGRTSREHEDVDVAVWQIDRATIHALLLRGGWRHTPDPGQDGFTTYERGGVRIDVAFLARDEHGTVHTPLADGRGSWPAGSFGTEVGEVAGVRSRVVSRASVVEDKSGPRDDPTTAAKDRADVALLTGQTRSDCS